MPVFLDVQARVDRASAEKAADEIAAIVKQAVHKGVQDALHEIVGEPPQVVDKGIRFHGDLSGALADIPDASR